MRICRRPDAARSKRLTIYQKGNTTHKIVNKTVDPVHSQTTDIASSPDAVAGRRDRRKAESRQRLLEAARKLFVERGYHGTRPQDISRLAEVGYGTFYLYFADKKDCFQAFVETAQQEIDALIRARLAQCRTPAERVYGVLEVTMDFSHAHPGVLKAAWAGHQLMAREEKRTTGPSLFDQWSARWAEVIRSGQKAGMICEDYDPKMIGYAVLMVAAAVLTEAPMARANKKKFLTNLTHFVLRALTAQRDAEGFTL